MPQVFKQFSVLKLQFDLHMDWAIGSVKASKQKVYSIFTCFQIFLKTWNLLFNIASRKTIKNKKRCLRGSQRFKSITQGHTRWTRGHTRWAEHPLLKFKTYWQEIKKAVLTAKRLAMFARFSADVPPIVSVLKAETARNVRKLRFFSENPAQTPKKMRFLFDKHLKLWYTI